MMTSEPRNYVLNGDRLDKIEKSVQQARDAALRAEAAAKSFRDHGRLYRETVCKVHSGELLELRSQMKEVMEKLNSKWPALLMQLVTQLFGFIVAILAWFLWLHPLVEKGK